MSLSLQRTGVTDIVPTEYGAFLDAVNMRALAEAWRDEPFVQPTVARLPWGHVEPRDPEERAGVAVATGDVGGSVGRSVGATSDRRAAASATSAPTGGTKLAPSRHQVQLFAHALEPRSLVELMEIVGRKDRTKFRTKYLKPLLDAGLVAMTVPDKPHSSRQRYVTTAAGKAVEAESRDHGGRP